MEELLKPRHDSVQRFLERWYGPASNGGDVIFPRAWEIPREIVDWHKAVASTGMSVTFADYPVALTDLKRSDDGMIVFWVENEKTYYWAIDPDLEEHEVFYRESASDVWRNTGETLGRFLLHCTVHEAIIGTESKFSAVAPPASALQNALTGFSPLPFRPLASEEPSTRLLCSSNALARIAPPPVGYARQGEQSWMLTIATVPGVNIQEYRMGLESYIPTGAGRKPIKVSIEDLPF
ncbi:hypothetical protein [Actinomadura alba]|uniref:SMI1/KNR4 family protein n=1 Tax=Actinomadura alba TaxID=406431 RepID=A0ABR7M2E2_9ACTN|nr:hypothetical protein [Actinomadura alba]MBC6471278.1 hypothetical protein [Actinomadura alba]